ncbi:recombinase family protein [Bradyrhizobium canariense]|uniref:recombinase family protein n=1 Tax=Bradyrhizobium canariense TaxID=255045 RepID=UPI00289B6785|nr:recombinase family protein [Bradyrhizobium canariense]
MGRWERSTVWAMLRNPAYKGMALFSKTRMGARLRVGRPLGLRGGLAPRNSANHNFPRTEWIEIPVPIIISEQTFALANELLKAKKKHARGARSHAERPARTAPNAAMSSTGSPRSSA